MGNTFGHCFRIMSWGESHGPGLPLQAEEIQKELNRRRPGQSQLVTPRNEADQVEILSGVFEGKTLGTPIALLVRNQDARPEAYQEIATKFRPSHADYTYHVKYGLRDWRGGGRASARETIGRVAAGAIAKKFLRHQFGVEIVACVVQIGEITAQVDPQQLTLEDVEKTPVRCPDSQAAEQMIRLIEQVRSEGDSVGGVILGIARNVSPGWGEPVFDRLEADLAKAMLSIPATKGFEIGSGFAGARMRGSEHNDLFFVDSRGQIRTRTNYSGGVQGGISNGELIYFRVAFKPTATILRPQPTVDIHLQPTTLEGRGRHDPCVLPRAVPIVEAMTALVLADHALRHHAQCEWPDAPGA